MPKDAGDSPRRTLPARLPAACILLALAILAGCATRPINMPMATIDRNIGYRAENRPERQNQGDTLLILAFSGGGTRAAAFAYGVLEELRRTEIRINARTTRLLDEVDIITGVSGGSFTALAYGLYGEQLFDTYDGQFLKRDIQGELIARFLNPAAWPDLWSKAWGRSELAARLYDDVLFHGATFADLQRRSGPWVLVTATDISTGSRLGFSQGEFDIICSDLSSVPLSRAAAASSAVPVVLSPVTINNYGGTCGYKDPVWARAITDPKTLARPAGRSLQRLREIRSFQDSMSRPFLHLVDGGLSDNLGMRAVLEGLEAVESSAAFRRANRVDSIRRIVVFVVNSLSNPATDWDKNERPPSDVEILLKASGVPIDRYSYEAVELLKDTISRWKATRELRAAGLFANAGNLRFARYASGVPDIDVFPIDVSFEALSDETERRYLMDLPTSFVLPPDAVDRLRAAAGKIIRESADFQRLVTDLNTSKPADNAGPRLDVR